MYYKEKNSRYSRVFIKKRTLLCQKVESAHSHLTMKTAFFLKQSIN